MLKVLSVHNDDSQVSVAQDLECFEKEINLECISNVSEQASSCFLQNVMQILSFLSTKSM